MHLQLSLHRKVFLSPVNTVDFVVAVMQLNQEAEILIITYLTRVAVKKGLSLYRQNISCLPNVVEILEARLKNNSLKVPGVCLLVSYISYA